MIYDVIIVVTDSLISQYFTSTFSTYGMDFEYIVVTHIQSHH